MDDLRLLLYRRTIYTHNNPGKKKNRDKFYYNRLPAASTMTYLFIRLILIFFFFTNVYYAKYMPGVYYAINR